MGCTADETRKDPVVYRVLVVDDEPENREILRRHLLDGNTLFQCELRESPNGQHALEAINGDWVPNLILLDLKMPVMDGHEFMQRFRLLNGRYKNTKFMVVSALGDVANHLKAAEFGAVTFVNKPFRRSQVVNVIYQALRESNHIIP